MDHWRKGKAEPRGYRKPREVVPVAPSRSRKPGYKHYRSGNDEVGDEVFAAKPREDTVARLVERMRRDEGFARKIVGEVASYVERYRSVGTLRLTFDVLWRYGLEQRETADAYYAIIKPILRRLEEEGLVELIDDLVVTWRGERRG